MSLCLRGNGRYTFGGTHDIDQGWLSDVRAGASNVRIVPRLLFEGWSVQDFRALFADDSRMTKIAKEITKMLKVRTLTKKHPHASLHKKNKEIDFCCVSAHRIITWMV